VADRFYIPEDWTGLTLQKDIYGDKGEIAYHSGEYWSDILKHESQRSFQLYHQALSDVTPKLGRKRAKESARYFLRYNTQLNFDWQMNFRSFVNIQKLRNSPHAQREIKAIANTMLYLVENIPDKPFQYTLKAFRLKSTVEDNLFL
jgi:thymidylate synthase ThyX